MPNPSNEELRQIKGLLGQILEEHRKAARTDAKKQTPGQQEVRRDRDEIPKQPVQDTKQGVEAVKEAAREKKSEFLRAQETGKLLSPVGDTLGDKGANLLRRTGDLMHKGGQQGVEQRVTATGRALGQAGVGLLGVGALGLGAAAYGPLRKTFGAIAASPAGRAVQTFATRVAESRPGQAAGNALKNIFGSRGLMGALQRIPGVRQITTIIGKTGQMAAKMPSILGGVLATMTSFMKLPILKMIGLTTGLLVGGWLLSKMMSMFTGALNSAMTAVEKWGASIMKQAAHLAEFSPSMARIVENFQVAEMFSQLKFGEATADSTAEAARATASLRDTMRRYSVGATNFWNKMQAEFAKWTELAWNFTGFFMQILPWLAGIAATVAVIAALVTGTLAVGTVAAIAVVAVVAYYLYRLMSYVAGRINAFFDWMYGRDAEDRMPTDMLMEEFARGMPPMIRPDIAL